MSTKGNLNFSCPPTSFHSNDFSKDRSYDSSLSSVNVSDNTELPMNFSFDSKEEDFDFLHFYGEMDDYEFHKMKILCSDEVFENGEWHTYAGLETCNVIKSTRHGNELLGKSIQSATERGDSGIRNLAYLSEDDTKLGTDHTKADVYESSNSMLFGDSIREDQNVTDINRGDKLFSLAREEEYKEAFSLRDKIGLCKNMEVELELKDENPFFIRTFPIKESDKDIVDKEMRKGCLLGILKKTMSSCSSPIMLIPRKLSGIPRIVTDFRHLNSRLVTLQPSIPLVRDAIQILGASGCEVLSLADLRDAYHTLRLSEKSKKYCGITPYYGSDSYLYQRLGMGLSVSPAIWQNFIQKVLQEIPEHRKNHLAIMDGCLVFSKKKSHFKHLTDLFKALIRNGLKISPRKCKLFKTSLVYMGHQVTIMEGIPHITPVKIRVESILKLDSPKLPKNCKQFFGMVNYLSMFLKDLQTKLIPIYHLTKKGVPFHWGEVQQKAFD